MSNNAAVTVDGGEIGRAQAVQARAARVRAERAHEPGAAQAGDRHGRADHRAGPARRHAAGAPTTRDARPTCCRPCWRASHHLAREADIVLVEGAGSPAEINLRAGDIANMGFARAADVPVMLVGDIDRGGVIASLVGTHAVLEPDERARSAASSINKFRGDVRLFDDGVAAIERRTGWPCARRRAVAAAGARGCRRRMRSISSAHRRRRAADHGRRADAVAHRQFRRSRSARAWSPACASSSCGRAKPLPGDADLVILPGSKSTIGDLAFLRAQGWDIDIAAHVRRGGRVLGLCGGYQMLGRTIADPDGIEGPAGTVAGLGLLDVDTVMTARQDRRGRSSARHCATRRARSTATRSISAAPRVPTARGLCSTSTAGRTAPARGRAGAGHLCARPVRLGRVSPRVPGGFRPRVVGWSTRTTVEPRSTRSPTICEAISTCRGSSLCGASADGGRLRPDAHGVRAARARAASAAGAGRRAGASPR